MDKHGRKMIAPVVIVLMLIAYYAIVVLMMASLSLPLIITVGIIAFSVAVSAAFIWVLIDRIKEIKGGEEDDLSKY